MSDRLAPISHGRGERVSLDPLDEDPKSWIKTGVDWDNNATVIDLFSGVGGMSFGLDSVDGLEVVAAFEKDPVACETHRANLPAPVVEGDLGEIRDFSPVLSDLGIKRVDIVSGGPPCQGFSRLGKGALRKIALENGRPASVDDRKVASAQDERNWMFRHFCRAVRQVEPKVIVIENVPNMLAHEPVMDELLGILEELGYDAEAKELSAHHFGVPQRRQRLFVIGSSVSGAEIHWPEASEIRRTVRDAIEDLPAIDPGHMTEVVRRRSPESVGPYLRTMRRGLTGKEKYIVRGHVTRVHRPEDIEAFDHMDQGDMYDAVPEELRRYRDDIFIDKYHRMIWDNPCWTVTAHLAKDGYKYIHPEQNRTLSVREAARLQSFPDRFRFAGSRTSRYAHIGNAVPPLLASALGPTLKKLVNR